MRRSSTVVEKSRETSAKVNSTEYIAKEHSKTYSSAVNVRKAADKAEYEHEREDYDTSVATQVALQSAMDSALFTSTFINTML